MGTALHPSTGLSQPFRSRAPDGSPDIRLYIASLAGGGSERVCADLSNGFVNLGLVVEVLLVNASGPYLARLDPRVRVVDFKASRGLRALGRVSKHLRGPPQHIPVLVFGFNLGVGLLGVRQIGLHKARVIYREGSSPRWNIRPPARWGYRWAISRADRVIAQTNAVRAELAELGVPVSNIVVIPNPCRAADRLTQPLLLEPGVGPLILGAGRLAPEKGFDRLIRAFASFRRQVPDARLTILGEGAERPRLERLIEGLDLTDCVTLPGFVADPGPWYQRASLFVLASHYEGQPNALMEAIAQGCPVLCAGGKGGMVEVMDACGIRDCVVPEDSFEQSFPESVRRALAKDNAIWQSARVRLNELAHPETVLQHYLAACSVSKPIR